MPPARAAAAAAPAAWRSPVPGSGLLAAAGSAGVVTAVGKPRGGSKKGRTQKKMPSGHIALRRSSVQMYYQRMQLQTWQSIPDLPMGRPKVKVEEQHVAQQIAKFMSMGGGDDLASVTPGWVLKTLRSIHTTEGKYDPTKDGRAAERPDMQKIQQVDVHIVFGSRKSGSNDDRARMISDHRAIEGRGEVGVGALRGFEQRHKVLTRKTPCTTMQSDEGDKRSVLGRKIFAQEMKDRIEAFRAGETTTADGLPALDPRGIYFWDEHHHTAALHPHSKHQKLYPVGPDGKFLSISEGGEIEPLVPRKAGKFRQQACGLFGVAAVNEKAVRSDCFRYSSSVVGEKRWQEEYEREIKRCWELPSKPYDPISGRSIYKGGDGEDQPRYLDNQGKKPNFMPGPGSKKNKLGEEGLRHRVRKSYTSMVDLFDFMVEQGDKAYAGTEWAGKWAIYHDPLKQFNERVTEEYMKSKGFTAENGRLIAQLRPGPYHGRTPGDSPELMPLVREVPSVLADIWGISDHFLGQFGPFLWGYLV